MASQTSLSAAGGAEVRISQLDGIRGLAIALVLIWHGVFGLVQVVPGSPAAYALRALSLTWAGVDLFFVLSGFLIGGILLANRHSARFFTTFYARRACRIFPLYYVMLAIFLACGALARADAMPEWQRWLFGGALPAWSYATYLQNFHVAGSGLGANWMAVTWSLAVEEQFYLVAPLMIWSLSPRALPVVLSVLIVLAPICRVALQWRLDPSGLASYVLLPARWDALFLGMLAAWAFRQPGCVESLRQVLPAIRKALAFGLVILAAMIATNQNIGSWGMTAAGYTVIAACALAMVLLAMISAGGVVHRLLRVRPLVWLGTISYGVYLFHQPIAGVLHGVLLGQPPRVTNVTEAAVTLLSWTCTLALAAASARFFERPIVAAGHRWARY